MYRRHTYAADISGPTWLYLLWAGRRLAYVGVAADPKSRMTAHKKKGWWATVTRVEYRWYPTRAEAFAREKESIVELDPLHNVARPKAALLRAQREG